MSWLLGAVNVSTSIMNEARGLAGQTPLLFVQGTSSPFLLAAGGLPETCLQMPSLSADSGWVVSGVGTKQDGQLSTVFGTADWHHVLSHKPSDLLTQNGHYAAIHWDAQGFHCFTDPLGIRTLYFTRSDNGVIFSTNLQWLAKLSHAHDLDYEVLGSQWLTFNQLSTSSPIQGIQRLGPGGYLYVNKTGYFRTTETPWTPSWNTSNKKDFLGAVTAYSSPRLPGNLSLSLGLSGGLDSRLLLASRYVTNPPHAHTFGPNYEPDVKIAFRIAKDLQLQHKILHDGIPSEAECLNLLKQQVLGNNAITTASAVLGLRYFDTLHANGYAIIDGGFGEIARRQFLNRLLLKGKNHLLKEDFTKVLPLLYTPRPEIFNKATLQIMQEGALKQFIALWHELPAHKEIGLENKLDLLSVRSRLPNFFGFEQNRLDSCILSYMPFAQPDVLDLVFGLPIKLRKNGKLFKGLIRKGYRPLTSYPLAKGDTTVPFITPALLATGLVKTKKRVQRSSTSAARHFFLQKLKTYALDMVNSGDVREYPAYNIQTIQDRVTNYYNGDQAHANFVDWWLAFDSWRQQVSEPI